MQGLQPGTAAPPARSPKLLLQLEHSKMHSRASCCRQSLLVAPVAVVADDAAPAMVVVSSAGTTVGCAQV